MGFCTGCCNLQRQARCVPHNGLDFHRFFLNYRLKCNITSRNAYKHFKNNTVFTLTEFMIFTSWFTKNTTNLFCAVLILDESKVS